MVVSKIPGFAEIGCWSGCNLILVSSVQSCSHQPAATLEVCFAQPMGKPTAVNSSKCCLKSEVAWGIWTGG